MARMTGLSIRNLRSIGDWVRVDFPATGPLVLIGENNAGKSSIVAVLDLVLGETWPGSFHPEDHHCFGRDRSAMPMQVVLRVADVVFSSRTVPPTPVVELTWRFDPDEERRCAFDVWTQSGQSYWATNDVRDQLACVVVGADRRVGYQLSYTSKWTLLSRLMRRFHERLVDDEDRVDRLRDRFAEVVAIFHEVAEFQAFSTELRTIAGVLAANMSYGLEMDFSAYDPSNYYRSLRVHPTSDGEVRSFDELGTGQEQILARAFAYAYARAYGEGDGGLVLEIEEPEAHLHPLAQQWLSRKIHELAAAGVQVVVTTHSPAFVDLVHVDGVACVRKPVDTGSTSVVQLSKESLANHCRQHGATKATAGNISEFYAASATEETKAGLFARACVVLEGPTEALALPLLLAACEVDPLASGIAVVNAGGVGSIGRWVRLYRAFGIPTFAIFDCDSGDDASGTKRADLVTTLGVGLDEYGSLINNGGDLVVRPTFAVLQPDFERCLRSMFPGVYEVFEAEARRDLGTGKPLVARAACAAVCGRVDLPGWASIRALAGAVAAILGQPSDSVTT